MSERGIELMKGASRQLAEMTEFFATLDEADLLRPCSGGDAGDTVGAVAAHAADGYHRLGQLLRSTGRLTGPPVSDRHGPGPHRGAASLPGLRTRLAGSELPIGLLATLTTEQLDSPAPPVPHVSTGRRTLEGLIEDVIAHQAAHLDALQRAVAPHI